MLSRCSLRQLSCLLLLLLLAACSSAPPEIAEAPTNPPQPEATTVPAESTVAPTSMPSSTPTSTASPVPATNTPQPTTTDTPQPTATDTPLPATATSTSTTEPLSPTAVPIEEAVRGPVLPRGRITARPWMVMIDNHPDAYPQSGMDKAALVFEGLAEFGVSRFIATYADGITPPAGEIGPVRSTRVYFAQWAMGFHPVYAHAGGSPDGQQLVQKTNALVNFEADGSAYAWRDKRRKAPHNLYTSAKLLRAFANDRGVAAFNDETVGYLYSTTPIEGAPATRLNYFFQDQGSAAAWAWSASEGVYYRTQRGRPHTDRITGRQLWTNNLVVMEVSGGRRAGDDKARIDQNVVGTGAARIFRNGRMIKATWSKPGAATPLRFYDAADVEIRFAPGSIWIAGIPTLERLGVR